MDLKSYFDQLVTLPSEEFAGFTAGLKETKFSKGEMFTRIGEENDRIGFVKAGVFKVYYVTPDGKEVIRNFCYEGKPIGSYSTILTGQAAHVNIEAVEDSAVLETTYAHFEDFFAKSAAWEKLGRKVAEAHYISRERREFQLLSLNAYDRYMAFRQDFPGLEARVTQVDIASYIGVDPATLSRLRSKAR